MRFASLINACSLICMLIMCATNILGKMSMENNSGNDVKMEVIGTS